MIKRISFSFEGSDCGNRFSDAVDFDSRFDDVSPATDTMTNLQKADSRSVSSIAALNYVVDSLKLVSGRKLVFFLSEGLTIPTELRSGTLLRTLSSKAVRSNVVFHTIDIRGLVNADYVQAADSINGIISGNDHNLAEKVFRGPRKKELKDSREGLEELAYRTGGDIIKDQNSFVETIGSIIENATGYYIATYYPNDEKFKGKEFHKIEIKLKNPELKVRASEGYFSTKPIADKAQPESKDALLYRAILSPFGDDEIETRLTTVSERGPNTGQYFRSLLFVSGRDLSFIELLDGRKKLDLEIASVTLDGDGNVVDSYKRTLTIQVPAESARSIVRNGLILTTDVPTKKEGLYEFRIVVRDNSSGLIGTAGEIIEFRDSKNEKFSMSDLMITGEFGADGQPNFPTAKSIKSTISVPSDPSNSALRKFVGGDRLFYTFTINNAKGDELTTQVRLLSDGKLVVEGSEAPLKFADSNNLRSQGSLQITTSVQLGDYVLEIVVRDKKNNKVISQSIDFEVVSSDRGPVFGN